MTGSVQGGRSPLAWSASRPTTSRQDDALPPTPVLGLPLSELDDVPLGPTTMSFPAIGVHTGRPVPEGEVTIGVVLEIPEPWATFLQSAREGFGDQLAPAIPTHITLLPPTALQRDRVEPVAAHLSAVARSLAPFDLLLSGTDTFRPVSPVVFVRVARGGEGCDLVQNAVRTGPLQRDLSFPFHPHVTVAHHLSDEALDRATEELADFAAAFTVDSFVLYEHGGDGVWRPQRRFRFGGGAT